MGWTYLSIPKLQLTYSSSSDSTQIDYRLYHKSFSSDVSNVKGIPREECINSTIWLMCDFFAHTSRVKKHKFAPHIRTWKLRDSATASLFQSAFKVKTMTAAALAQMLILQIALSQLGPTWRAPCWTLPPKFVVSQRTTSRNQKPGGGQSYAKESCTVQDLQCPEEGMHNGGGKVWGAETGISRSTPR